MASSNTEVLNIKKRLAQLSEQVKRHDRWLTTNPITLFLSQNSHDRPAFILDLERLEKQINDHQGYVDRIRKKFNLVEKRQQNLA